LSKYKYLIVDLDGVVWRGFTPLTNNISVLKKLAEKGIKILFLTNNSTRSRHEYLEKLSKYSFKISLESIITSGYLAAEYVKNLGGRKVFVVGEAGLYYELVNAGLIPVTIGTSADHVVVGLDRFLTYNKISYASRLIMEGASFIASNCDKTYPVEDGVEPGAGSIVAMISEAVGREPDIITGKPNPWVLDYIFDKYDVDREEVLIIGDRMDTDVYMGYQRKVDTLYVLTGVGKLEDVNKYGFKPTFIARDLVEFIEKHKDLF